MLHTRLYSLAEVELWLWLQGFEAGAGQRGVKRKHCEAEFQDREAVILRREEDDHS